MAILVYIFIGMIIGSIFMLTPHVEFKSVWSFLLLVIGWLPLFLVGVLFLSFFDRNKMMI
ncbi:hypothetical protein [Calidifontibacillus erzurumensis]|uniref:Uncharacterized protein n=1 Tax=Calidifontibacillus erzurumensis TaxID=2741433 RepID=A0A8J8GCI2_9BACI|nr:hypothetical protein [Calidifontibacillus erzurumensis]NSL50636.1 hypothetical protein [Calidifontibacillus erzurumensis]